MTNTKGEGQGGDPFWDKAERLLLVSLIAYLHYEAPVEELSLIHILACQVHHPVVPMLHAVAWE